ncbi:MAG: SpoIID/LytB domain-containing protein [Clostridiales bacterium]|nr:SpoIID/LytB domain-containing protein [Clostridiales bacterium]
MRKILIIFFVLSLGAVLSGCGKTDIKSPESKTQAGAYGEAKPVTRGEAARMLALCLYGYNEICSMEEVAEFTDVSREDSLYKYINAVYSAGAMTGGGETFRPGDYLTVGEAEIIIKNADKSGRLSIAAEDETAENPVSYYIWTQILSKMNEAEDFSGISVKETALLKAGQTGSEIEGYAVTSAGLFKTDGFLDNSLEDNLVEFIVKGESIIGVLSVKSSEIDLKSCLVLSHEDGEAVVFAEGVKKNWKCGVDIEEEAPFGADLTVTEGKITALETFPTEKEGRIIAVNNGLILFDDGYSYETGENFRVYNTYEGISCGGAEKLLSGENIKVLFKDNKAVFALCSEKFDNDVIRVALSSSDGSLIRKSVNLGADSEYTVGGEKFSQGDTVEINSQNKNDYFNGKLTSLEAKTGIIKIDGAEYEGKADILVLDGGYCVVLETSLEYYLTGVVCAEMPSFYGSEALKAQALAARSYAYNQMRERGAVSYGANVDDTKAYQVFDVKTICEESKAAVKETEGEVIMYKGDVINACFYSTSCGIGANSGEIWGKDGIYPWITPEYLSSRAIGDVEADFSSKEKALEFFKSLNSQGLECAYPYYRWSVTASAADFTAEVGEVESVEIIKRGEGGNVMEILIEGDEADETVTGEGNVRKILKKAEVKRSDGSTASLDCLPSSFFAVEVIDGTIYFYGGGYGHGVGMSQNGADALSALGYNYKEIIEYFYKGAEVGKI